MILHRTLLFSAASFLVTASSALLALPAVEPAPAASPAPASAAEDPWLVTLSALLAERYRVAGELRLSWHRALPAAAPRDADLELVAAPAVLAPQILVHVRARDAAGRVTDHSLLLRAELWREAWVLRQPAAAGAPLQLADLEPRPVDTLRERDALAFDSASASDAPAEHDFARAVPAGRVLVWRDVVRRPLVRRGRPVEVVATDGALTISLRAVALHDAARGEPVRVRNPDSKREFVAVVTADSRASVRF